MDPLFRDTDSATGGITMGVEPRALVNLEALQQSNDTSIASNEKRGLLGLVSAIMDVSVPSLVNIDPGSPDYPSAVQVA